MVVKIGKRVYGVGWILKVIRLGLVMALFPKEQAAKRRGPWGTVYSVYVRHLWIQLRFVDARDTMALYASRDDCTKMLALIRQSERYHQFRTPEPSEADVRRHPCVHAL